VSLLILSLAAWPIICKDPSLRLVGPPSRQIWYKL